MASSLQNMILFVALLVLLFICSSINAQQSFRPKGLVLPVTKDASTLQYVTQIKQRTPLVPVNLVVDVGGQFLWVDCDQSYISSTYHPSRCKSAQCSLANASGCGNCFSTPKPGCFNNTCSLNPDNTVTNTATSGQLGDDVVSVNSTDGMNPGQAVTVSRFLFVCAPTFLLEGLANGVMGMAGLGRTRISLPSQFAATFSFHKKFAICLTSPSTTKGVIFFGDGPYSFLPGIDASQLLTYTPLIINPVSTASASSQGEPSSEYFIQVTSITVGETSVPLNTSLLSIDSNGYGGTKISTVNPYTVLETSIFSALAQVFVNETAARNISRVEGVKPFDVCFSMKNVVFTRVGLGVPYINLVLDNNSTVWTITGSNSVVVVNDDVFCLAFVDGGLNPRTSIVIGGYQMEDNLLQFDLASSRLGFSSTLLGRRTNCGNFNFTSTIL